MEQYNQIKEVVEIVKKVAQTKEVTHKDKTSMNRLLEKVDKSFLKKKHAMVAWTNMLNSFEKQLYGKAVNHSKKVMIQIRPVANDSPFEVRDKVNVTRYEHGWLDGRMEAIIKSREQNSSGVWSYTAQVTRIENEEIVDPNYLIEIRHTRDASLMR